MIIHIQFWLICFLYATFSTAATITTSFSPDSKADEMIVEAIQKATGTITVANFHLSNHKILNALLGADDKVNITILLDRGMGEAAYQPTLNSLAARKNIHIYLLTSPLYNLLHLKCAVLDHRYVLSGASNWSEDSFNANYEDTLLIDSPNLATQYDQYFTSLLSACTPYEPTAEASDEKASPISQNDPPLNTPFRKTFDIADSSIGFSFATRENVRDKILGLINLATQTIDIAVYYLSDREILSALLARMSSNSLSMRVVVDGETLSFSSSDKLYELAELGCAVYYHQIPRSSMHLKCAIFDGKDVITGSINWTDSSFEKNVEDSLIIHDAQVAAFYKFFLDDIISKCKPVETYSHYDESVIDSTAYPFYFPTDPNTFTEPRKFESFNVTGRVAYVQDGNYLPTLLDLINQAHQSILISMFAIPARVSERVNLDKIIKALCAAHNRGVYIYIVLDLPHDKKDGLYESHLALARQLTDMGIEARLCVPPVELHEKLVVVDLCKILTGNHNWSEGSLDGTGVLDSSALLTLDLQEPRFAEYIMGKNVIGDMSSDENMRREIDRYFFRRNR